MQNEQKGLLYGFFGVVFFSLSLPATRMAVAGLPAEFVTAIRLAGAGLLSLAFLLARQSRWPQKRELGGFAAVAAGVVIGFPLFSALAMQSVDASHGGVVLALLPLFTALAAMIFAGERPGALFFFWAGLGTLTVLAFVLSRSSGGLVKGDLFLVVASALAAIGYAAGGDLSRKRPGLEVIAWALVLCLPLSLVALGATWPDDPVAAGARAWIATGYVTVFAQFIGFFFFYRGLALGGVARVGQIQLLQVYMTLAASALLLGEQIDGMTLAAALLTVVFVWLGRRTR